MPISAIKPIPVDLREQFNDIPLDISDRIFSEMKSKDAKDSYKKVQVIPTAPEWRFVWLYFHHDKPHRYGIKMIYCVYERHQQKTFEFNLSSIEREADNFKPKWGQEPRFKQRAQAIERRKQMVNVFFLFFTIETDGRKRNWKNTKIIPLWHGSCKEMCESSFSRCTYFLHIVYALNRFFTFLLPISSIKLQILMVKIIFRKSKNSFIAKIIEKFLEKFLSGQYEADFAKN